MKKLITICAAALAFAVMAADTDCGVLITTGNIADSAKVENLTGANAGKATITINDNDGTAKSVTVYNAATVDTTLSGKASTGDVTALQNRATALETATNNLTSAVATAQSAAESASAAANTAYQNATNNAAQTYVKKSGDTMTGALTIRGANELITSYYPQYLYTTGGGSSGNYLSIPGLFGSSRTPKDYLTTMPEGFNIIADRYWVAYWVTNTIPSWARASSKPSYNFSEIGSKPTTIAGYGITDAKIENGTITLGSNSIMPLTSYTETDPVWTAAKGSYSTTVQMNSAITAATNGLAKASALTGYVPNSRKVAGMALSSDITLKDLSIVGSSTTTYNGSAAASVNQSTLTEAAKTAGGTTGKTLTLAVASTSRSLGEYYISIGSDGKPHLMLRQ